MSPGHIPNLHCTWPSHLSAPASFWLKVTSDGPSPVRPTSVLYTCVSRYLPWGTCHHFLIVAAVLSPALFGCLCIVIAHV